MIPFEFLWWTSEFSLNCENSKFDSGSVFRNLFYDVIGIFMYSRHGTTYEYRSDSNARLRNPRSKSIFILKQKKKKKEKLKRDDKKMDEEFIVRRRFFFPSCSPSSSQRDFLSPPCDVFLVALFLVTTRHSYREKQKSYCQGRAISRKIVVND